MLILEQLKELDNFTETEIFMAKFIIANPKKTCNLSIVDLADITFSSPSSIVRFCKKLHTKGFSDFKIKLAIELNMNVLINERISNDFPLQADQSLEEVSQAMFNLLNQTLVDTYNTIDLNLLKKVADLIHNSDYIILRGVGPSLLLAQDFNYKIRTLGKVVDAAALIGFESKFSNVNSKNPIILIVSQYANSRNVKRSITEAKNLKIPIVLLTCNESSPLIDECEHVIFASGFEEDKIIKLGSIASNFSMSYILDLIYSFIFQKNYDINVEALKKFARNSEFNSDDKLSKY